MSKLWSIIRWIRLYDLFSIRGGVQHLGKIVLLFPVSTAKWIWWDDISPFLLPLAIAAERALSPLLSSWITDESSLMNISMMSLWPFIAALRQQRTTSMSNYLPYSFSKNYYFHISHFPWGCCRQLNWPSWPFNLPCDPFLPSLTLPGSIAVFTLVGVPARATMWVAGAPLRLRRFDPLTWTSCEKWVNLRNSPSSLARKDVDLSDWRWLCCW